MKLPLQWLFLSDFVYVNIYLPNDNVLDAKGAQDFQ